MNFDDWEWLASFMEADITPELIEGAIADASDQEPMNETGTNETGTNGTGTNLTAADATVVSIFRLTRRQRRELSARPYPTSETS